MIDDEIPPFDLSALLDCSELLPLLNEPVQAGIPLLITLAQKARLRDMGYMDAAISEMTPANAHAILNSNN